MVIFSNSEVINRIGNLLKENPNATIVTDDDYEIDDYNVKVFHHSGICDLDYRKWMYERFGNEYATGYLFK